MKNDKSYILKSYTKITVQFSKTLELINLVISIYL